MASKKLAMFLMPLLCATGIAQSAEPNANPSLSIGPGVVITGKPYAGMNTTVYPVPLMTFTSGRFYISGATAGYQLLDDQGWTFDAIGKWRFDGYDADDSDELAGMHNRHMTIDVGGELTAFGDWGVLKAGLVTDALSQHDGQEMRITYAKPFDIEKLNISPSVGFSWLSSNLADYYYGVRVDEALAGRPAYNPGDAVNWFAGLGANYHLDDNWTLLADITCYWLDSKIHDSPIVSDSYMISITAGVMYRF
jgi:outer membrane protein